MTPPDKQPDLDTAFDCWSLPILVLKFDMQRDYTNHIQLQDLNSNMHTSPQGWQSGSNIRVHTIPQACLVQYVTTVAGLHIVALPSIVVGESADVAVNKTVKARQPK